MWAHASRGGQSRGSDASPGYRPHACHRECDVSESSCTHGDAAEKGDEVEEEVGAAVVECVVSPTVKTSHVSVQVPPKDVDAAAHQEVWSGANDTPDSHIPANKSDASLGEEDGEASINIMAPTSFITAAGRCICVREWRCIEKGSPYWRLLFESPLREGISTSSDGVTGEVDAAPHHRRSPPPWRRRPREANTSFSPPHVAVCHESRCRSCPASVTSTVVQEDRAAGGFTY